MKRPEKPVSDNESSRQPAFKCRTNGEVTPASEDWAALSQSLQERRRILRRRAVLLSELEQLRVTASAKLQAAAGRRYRK